METIGLVRRCWPIGDAYGRQIYKLVFVAAAACAFAGAWYFHRHIREELSLRTVLLPALRQHLESAGKFSYKHFKASGVGRKVGYFHQYNYGQAENPARAAVYETTSTVIVMERAPDQEPVLAIVYDMESGNYSPWVVRPW